MARLGTKPTPEPRAGRKNCEDSKGGDALADLLSARLRRWRRARRIPIKKIAADMEVSVSVVSAWETGSRFPSASHLQQLSVYTGVPVCQFLYAGPADCPQAPSCSLL